MVGVWRLLVTQFSLTHRLIQDIQYRLTLLLGVASKNKDPVVASEAKVSGPSLVIPIDVVSLPGVGLYFVGEQFVGMNIVSLQSPVHIHDSVDD